MPTLLQRIDEDLKTAAKAKDALRLSVLRMAKSAIKYREIELAKELEDGAVRQVLMGLVKQRRDSAEQYRKGGRNDLAEKEEREIEVLQEYLPTQLSPEELGALVDQAVAQLKATDMKQMGAVMKAVTEKVAGRAEGKDVSDAVKSRLLPKNAS